MNYWNLGWVMMLRQFMVLSKLNLFFSFFAMEDFSFSIFFSFNFSPELAHRLILHLDIWLPVFKDSSVEQECFIDHCKVLGIWDLKFKFSNSETEATLLLLTFDTSFLCFSFFRPLCWVIIYYIVLIIPAFS